MVSVKELRSVDLASYTIMTTAIAVLFSIIASILLVIAMGVASPEAIGVSIYLISTIVVGTLMFTTYNAFCQGFLYNLLAKRLNSVQIALKDEKEVLKVTPTSTAIIIAMILTIQVILLYLASVFIFPMLLNSIIQTLMYSGQELLAYSLYQFLMLLSQPTTIMMMIFGTFIVTFVFALIGCYIYNLLGNAGKGLILNLSEENGMTAVDSVDVKKFAIVFGVVGGVLNLITALMSLVSGGSIATIIVNVIGGFIAALLYGALIAIFYNFLAPKLGKLKLELIDQ